MEEHEKWHARWAAGRIGFHQPVVNPELVGRWPELVPNAACTVLVPLCGKSLDMLWLHARGHRVIGVELSERACRAFFEENALQYTTREVGQHLIFEADDQRLVLWCGDFFTITDEQLGRVDAFYDRAAIVALPPECWAQYAHQFDALVSDTATGLMLVFDYPQAEREGPPYSVSATDVSVHFGEYFHCALVDCIELTADNHWSLSRLQAPILGFKRL